MPLVTMKVLSPLPPIPSMASMSPRVDTNGRTPSHCRHRLAAIGAAQKMRAGGMMGGDLAARNVDVAARRADAGIDHDWRAPCFGDRRSQISKLLALSVGGADDEDASHLETSGPPSHR